MTRPCQRREQNRPQSASRGIGVTCLPLFDCFGAGERLALQCVRVDRAPQVKGGSAGMIADHSRKVRRTREAGAPTNLRCGQSIEQRRSKHAQRDPDSSSNERGAERLVRRRKSPVQSANGNIQGSGHVIRRELPVRAALREAVQDSFPQGTHGWSVHERCSSHSARGKRKQGADLVRKNIQGQGRRGYQIGRELAYVG